MKDLLYGEGMKLGKTWLIGLLQAVLDHLLAKLNAWNVEHSETARLRNGRTYIGNLQQAFRACETQEDYIKVFMDLADGRYNAMAVNADPRGNAFYEKVRESNDKLMEMARKLVVAKRKYFESQSQEREADLIDIWRKLARATGFPDHLTLGSVDEGHGNFTKLTEKHGRLVVAAKELLAAKNGLSYGDPSTQLRLDGAWEALNKALECLPGNDSRSAVPNKQPGPVTTFTGEGTHIGCLVVRGMKPEHYLRDIKELLGTEVQSRIEGYERRAQIEVGFDKWAHIEPLATIRDKVNDCQNMHALLKVCESIRRSTNCPKAFVHKLRAATTPYMVALLIRIHSEE